MDRIVVTQVIAMLIVLSALVRWLPDDQRGDPLGLGDPYEALELDRALVTLGVDSDAAHMHLRVMRVPPKDQAGYRHHWQRALNRMREIQSEIGPDGFVQFRGVPRNDIWSLMYMLYPIRHSFETYEDGSTASDPLIPGAVTLDMTVKYWNELPAQDPQKRLQQRPGGR